MALKIDDNQSATAFHINDGAKLFPYALDARSAISTHPLEWSDKPWTPEAASAARKQLHDYDVADAKAKGQPAPAAPPAPAPLLPEDQAALDAHNKAVAEAAKRLADYYKKRDEQKKIDEQVAADEALVASIPPQPDPNAPRRPLSPAQIRKAAATLTPAEQAEVDRKNATSATAPQGFTTDAAAKAAADKKVADDAAAAQKAADDRHTAEKAEADRLAASGAKPTF